MRLNEKNLRRYFNRSKYCCESITCIENYGKASLDNFKGWHIHHRLETHTSDGIQREIEIESSELIALGMYWNRPASELVFLTSREHGLIHNHRKSFHLSDESKAKISASRIGDKNPAKKPEVKANISKGVRDAAIKKGIDYTHQDCRDAYKNNNPEHLSWNDFQKNFYKGV